MQTQSEAVQVFYLFVLKQIKLKLLTLTFTTKYCDGIAIGDNLIPFQGKIVLEKKGSWLSQYEQLNQ